MPEGFLADLVALFMVGCNIDEPAVELGLTPSPVELIPLAGSHRAPPVPTGRAKVFEGLASLVPNWVARFEGECRSLPMRADGDVGGAR